MADPDAKARQHPPLCFVHALLAAGLRRPRLNKKPQHLYINVASTLGLTTPNLRLPLTWESEERQARDDIVVGEALGTVRLGPIPILVQYSTFLDYFTATEPRAAEHFAYDFRRDLRESAELLVDHLRAVRNKHGRTAQVVGHSMGCLVALAALKLAPELFHSVLFAGGNFAGGAGFYPWNTVGRYLGLNSKVLDGDVMGTWPSMYAGASPVVNDPALKRTDGKDLFPFVEMEKWVATGEEVPVPIDHYSIDDWIRHRLGPWRVGARQPVSVETREHVEHCLRRGKQFQQLMRSNDRPAEDFPPVATLVGDGFVTPDFLLWSTVSSAWVPWTKKLAARVSPESLQQTDGTISYISASNPPGVRATTYHARHNGPKCGAHRELMNEVELISQIFQDLEAAANGVAAPAPAPMPAAAMGRLGNAEMAEASVRDARRVRRSKTMARGAFELAPWSQGAMGARAAWDKLAKHVTSGALQAEVVGMTLGKAITHSGSSPG